MKKIIPMPEWTPPPKKPIEELLSQECIEKRDDGNRRSYANAQFSDYTANNDNPTRPDLCKDEE